MSALPITGDPAADQLLEENPLALLIGMLLDQQVTMELAFKGPSTIQSRLGSLDAISIAAIKPDAWIKLCSETPAIHRFPKSMGQRVQEMCAAVSASYDGDPTRIWTEAKDAKDLYRRLRELPGFGDEKTKIFIALLAKRFDIAPRGWKAVAAPFSDRHPRSVADVADAETLLKVREWKKAMKAAKKSKQETL